MSQTSGRSVKNTPNPPNKNQPKKKNRARKRQPGSQEDKSLSLGLHPCSLVYARSLLDPFNARVQGTQEVCIPDVINIPSYKFSTITRLTVTLGTGLMGYVVISPRALGNDTVLGYYTLGNYSGTTISNAVGTGVTSFNDTQFPFAASALRPTRLVACGVRARYIGTELNRGGQVVPVCAYATTDEIAGDSISDVLTRPNVSSHECDRRWHSTVWNQPFTASYDYDDTARSAATVANCRMAILMNGTATNTYEIEVVRFFEMIPGAGATLAVPVQSSSHTDLPGLSVIKDFMGSLMSSDAGQQVYQNFLLFAQKSLISAASSYSYALGNRYAVPRIEL